MLHFARGGTDITITPHELAEAVSGALSRLGVRKKVLAVPPDFTRFHSRSGEITRIVHRHYGEALAKVLIASGTHRPMTDKEIQTMFGDIPRALFLDHDFRKDVATLGEVPASFIKEVSEGACDWPWPAQVNKLIAHGGFDLILSIGQVVPHEVTGFANYTKNIFVGTGGAEAINKSHFLGAVYGMERMMGKADTPVRKVLNRASDHFLKDKPIVYILTVMGCDECGKSAIKGLFIGDDDECFLKAAELSVRCNFTALDAPLEKTVVWLDPTEYKSAWLCNKAIYRTRMAMADSGTLVILAPGMKEFGEDPEIDRLIRKYGYHGTPATLSAVRDHEDIRANLSAAAHLIHGSSEGRFEIVYSPGHVSRAEIEAAGYRFGDLAAMLNKYDPEKLKDGFNTLPDGEKIFYISQPAQGLWAFKGKLTGR
jgi:nickel-dependent lactate racemase